MSKKKTTETVAFDAGAETSDQAPVVATASRPNADLDAGEPPAALPSAPPSLDPYGAAIQEVLADPDYQHVGAHGTEVYAVRKLVERGHDEAEAEREVRRRLY